MSEHEEAGDTGPALHLFEAFGIEIEYALVDRNTLDVLPIADRVLQSGAASERPVNDWICGELGWSNELVLHGLGLKNCKPQRDLDGLRDRMSGAIANMARALEAHGARLMPGGMHPWMDPRRETKLWPHGHAAVYEACNSIFDCRTHGWANVQSMHVNLPFSGDHEFAQLHAAVRTLLPLLPALAAASPYIEGCASEVLDRRMQVYAGNADAIPQMNGDIIPDSSMSATDYRRHVLEPLYRAVAPHDPAGLLQAEWLNARGVIPRFDRSALEIRVLDTQECPHMDLGYAAFVIDLARSLCEREFARPTLERQLPTRMLSPIFRRCVAEADRARIDSSEFLEFWGITRSSCDAAFVLSHLAERLERENAPGAAVWREPIAFTLTRGALARRLVRAVGPRPSRGALHELYAALCDALVSDRPFDP